MESKLAFSCACGDCEALGPIAENAEFFFAKPWLDHAGSGYDHQEWDGTMYVRYHMSAGCTVANI